MKLLLPCAAVFCLQSAANATQEKFLGQLAGAVIGGAAQSLLSAQAAAAAAPSAPSPEEAAAEKALARAREASDAAAGAKDLVKTLKDNYGEMEAALALPLAQSTAALQTERRRLALQLAALAAQTRQLFDGLHPELALAPLVVVAKSADDSRRSEVNKIDLKGQREALAGESSACSAFHAERAAEKAEIESAQATDTLNQEAQTLALMAPEERLEYDRTMADENAAKVQELQATIEYERKQAGILSPTQRLLLGALAPVVPHVPTA